MGFSAIYRKEVRPKVKYAVIHRHREEYSVSIMCKFFGVSRSGYYGFVHSLDSADKDSDIADCICKYILCTLLYLLTRLGNDIAKASILCFKHIFHHLLFLYDL